MIEIKLPFWLTSTQTSKLISAAQTFWNRLETWVSWPLSQLDPMTCDMGILNLIAWQRHVERFATEPENLYRLRVKHALVNAQDAGSKAGFIRIFERLGIGYLEIEERTDPTDWDVVLLYLSDSQIAQNTELLQRIIEKYGRTCRRYQLVVLTPITAGMDMQATGHHWDLDVATI